MNQLISLRSSNPSIRSPQTLRNVRNKVSVWSLILITSAAFGQTSVQLSPSASQTINQPSGSSLNIQGNVGIGTTSPGQQLQVGSDTYAGPASNGVIRVGATNGQGSLRSWDFGINQSVSPYNFYFQDTVMPAPAMTIQYGTGNVGIGTVDPGYPLDIHGSLNLTGSILLSGIPFITPSSNNGIINFFFGDSGNSSTTGSYNTGTGLFALGSNTSGSSNSAFGQQALTYNTTGFYNTAIGTGSLYENETGSYNTATGLNSLYTNTTGGNNNGFGFGALGSITTGSYNIGIGNQAGSVTLNNSFANQTSDASIYIGYDTQAKADGDSNEIVIGNLAQGNGSNTVTLGNQQIQTTVLQGNVGIGTATPSALLEVNGNTQIDGNLSFASGHGINFSNGTLTSLPPGANGTPITSTSLPSDIVYTDKPQPQTITSQTSFMSAMGIGTTNPSTALQVGTGNSKISLPGVYNFENIYLGQYGNGAAGLEFVNHINQTASYGIKLLTNADSMAGLQVQLAQPAGTYGELSYSTVIAIPLSGNVGIGTTTPGQKLEVNGNIMLTQNPANGPPNGAGIIFPDGSVQTTAYILPNCPVAELHMPGQDLRTVGGDYAESIDVTGDKKDYEPGDVMVVDPSNPGHVLKSSTPYSTLVAGIYSTKPGFVGRRQTTNPKTATSEIPMAMVGVVPTKVSTENGPIKVGDLLVTSSTVGYAMRGTDSAKLVGAVVGKAFGDLGSGTGVIEVLVTLQ